jgi:hypothetical protein
MGRALGFPIEKGDTPPSPPRNTHPNFFNDQPFGWMVGLKPKFVQKFKKKMEKN